MTQVLEHASEPGQGETSVKKTFGQKMRSLFAGFRKTTADSNAVRHAPLNYFLDYKVGLEKSILDGIRMEMHSRCIQFDWDKRLVHFKIEKVVNHPHIEPGYIYELVYNGDGHSYLPQILELFKNPDVRVAGVPLSKSGLVLVHFSGNSQAGFESELWKDPNRNMEELRVVDGLHFLDFRKNAASSKPLYKDNYVPYFVASMMFWASVLSLPIAGMYKYVWVDRSKVMVDKEYYTESKYLPVKAIRAATDPSQGSESERILAVRYSLNRGWHIAIEQKQDNGEEPVRLEKKINKDGTLSSAVPSVKEDVALMGIPLKKSVQAVPKGKKGQTAPKRDK